MKNDAKGPSGSKSDRLQDVGPENIEQTVTPSQLLAACCHREDFVVIAKPKTPCDCCERRTIKDPINSNETASRVLKGQNEDGHREEANDTETLLVFLLYGTHLGGSN